LPGDSEETIYLDGLFAFLRRKKLNGVCMMLWGRFHPFGSHGDSIPQIVCRVAETVHRTVD